MGGLNAAFDAINPNDDIRSAEEQMSFMAIRSDDKNVQNRIPQSMI